MKREEQIEVATATYINGRLKNNVPPEEIEEIRLAYQAGAIYADEHPNLYSVTRKAVERERKYLIDKACKRLENIFHDRSHHSGRGDAGEIVTYDFDSMEEFISQFRKDMEEQQ